jgi:hypothetical protein
MLLNHAGKLSIALGRSIGIDPDRLLPTLVTVDGPCVRELIASRRICESWVVTDGNRELMVRGDDMVRLLAQNARPMQVQTR